MRRRNLLLAAATTGTAALAGCIDEFDAPGADGSDDPEENGSEGDTESNGDDEFEPTFTDDVAEGLVTQYATVRYRANVEGTSSAVFENAERALDELGIGETDEGNESTGGDDPLDRVRSLIESTNFETESLVALEAQGSNGCYELELQNVAASEDDGLEIEAAAVENREDDEVCTEAIVELGLLVRVQYENDDPVDDEGSIGISGPSGSSGSGWASDSVSDGGSSGDASGE